MSKNNNKALFNGEIMTEITDSLSGEASRLKKLRLYLGLTRKDFELKFGVSRHTLRAWEVGEKKFNENAINRVVSALNSNEINCSYEWFVSGVGDSPILMQESVDYSSSIEFDPVSEKTLNEVLFYKKNNPTVEVFVVGDIRFEPIALSGDYVGLKKIRLDECKNFIGSVAYIKSFSDDNYLYVIRIDKKDQISFVSLNNKNMWDLKFLKQDFVKIIVWYKKIFNEEN